MPSFSLHSTDGSVIDSDKLDGSVIVIVFTCNHCPYAQAYEDRLIDLSDQFEEENVQFILISSNDAEVEPEDSFEQMKEVHQESGYQFPYCFDESQDIAKAYGALCTPHCFVFDEEHILRYKGCVDDNWKDPNHVKNHYLRDAISSLLNGEEPPVQEANALGCSIKWK